MVKIVLLVLICLLLASPLSAQIVPYCGQLAEADCALLLDAQESLIGIHSATLNRAAFTIGEGIDGGLNISGNVTNLQFGEGPQLLSLSDLQAAVTLSVDSSFFPDELRNLLRLDAMDARLIEGILYLDLGSLEPRISTQNGWVSIDLKTQMPGLFQIAPSDSDSVVTGADLEQLIATFSPDVLNQFVTVTRQGDVFETQVDFAAMYAHPMFQTTLRDQLLAYWRRHGRTTEITDANLAHLAAEMNELFPEPMTVYAIRVDAETRTAQALQYWGMDSLVMVEVGASGGDTSGWEPATLSLSFNFDEAIAPIIAPEEAQPITEAVLKDVPIITYLFGSQIA